MPEDYTRRCPPQAPVSGERQNRPHHGKELALELEEKGYDWILKTVSA